MNDRPEHFVDTAPWDPHAVEALTPEQERYYLATQWRLMWWKLKRHKLAVASGIVLLALYASVLVSEFLAPYNLHSRNIRHIHAPPQTVRLFHDGEFIGPFVYGYSRSLDLAQLKRVYEEDPSRVYPLRFFCRGDGYRFWGLFEADLHLVCPAGEEGATLFLLGTDRLGRDVLSRIIYGARTTIGVSFAATVLAYIIGVIFGIAAAVGGSKLDMGLSRVNDAFISIPHIMMGLVIIAAVGSTIPILIVTAGCIYATTVFRISRALALDVMVSDFVESARARGEGLWWIIRREILPNIAMPLATDFGLRLVFIILFISSLSFLGLGVQPPDSDWGSMVKENLQGLVYGSLSPIAPAIAIATLTISINLIVDDVSAHAGGRLAKRML